MTDLGDLYRRVVLEHSKRPRNQRIPDGANRTAEKHNPLCGDRIAVHLVLRDGLVVDAGFQGTGCAISVASASMLTERVAGLSVAETRALAARLAAQWRDASAPEDAGLGDLAALRGVIRFPVRIPCAAAAWDALEAALRQPA